MIYIIPISHQVQARDPKTYPLAKDFINYLKKKSIELNINYLAEEWSVDASTDRGTNISNVSEVIDELGMDRDLLEKSIQERSELGIPLRSELKRKYFPEYSPIVVLSKDEELFLDKKEAEYYVARETYWLQKLKNKLSKNMILICGSSHTSVGNKHLGDIKSFDEKLKDLGYETQVLTEDFFLNPHED